LIVSLSLWHIACAQRTLAVPTVSNETKASHEGRFHDDVAGVIGRSDIVLGRPKPPRRMLLMEEIRS
jgi:hypothetical protein